MSHAVFILLHATFASVALVAAAFSSRGTRWFVTYYVSMALMLLFLVMAIAVDWAGRTLTEQAVNVALTALGAFMMLKAEWARRIRWRSMRSFIGHVGFTVVGLVDAFVVVTMLNLGAPGWLVGIVGLAIALIGHLIIGVAQRRAASPP